MAKRGRPKKVTDGVVELDDQDYKDVEKDTQVIDEPAEVLDSSDDEIFKSDNTESTGTFGNYNPLGDNVIEREYSTPKTAEGYTQDIPEPDYGGDMSFEDILNSSNESEEEEQSNPFDNPNEALNDLPNEEKRIACESLVDTALDTYATVLNLVSKWVQVSDDKISDLIAEDEIDGDMRMPIEGGGDVSLQEFFQTYNEQAEDTIKYDRNFGLKVRPYMVRLFMRKGWGMTDDQVLMVMWGKEIVGQTMKIYGLKKSINSTLNLLKEIHAEQKKGIPTEPRAKRPEPVQEEMQEEVYEPENDTIIIDDETEIGQGLDNSNYEEVKTQKMDIPEFKRPEETTHPDLVQKEMDKANIEAKAKSKTKKK